MSDNQSNGIKANKVHAAGARDAYISAIAASTLPASDPGRRDLALKAAEYDALYKNLAAST